MSGVKSDLRQQRRRERPGVLTRTNGDRGKDGGPKRRLAGSGSTRLAHADARTLLFRASGWPRSHASGGLHRGREQKGSTDPPLLKPTPPAPFEHPALQRKMNTSWYARCKTRNTPDKADTCRPTCSNNCRTRHYKCPSSPGMTPVNGAALMGCRRRQGASVWQMRADWSTLYPRNSLEVQAPAVSSDRPAEAKVASRAAERFTVFRPAATSRNTDQQQLTSLPRTASMARIQTKNLTMPLTLPSLLLTATSRWMLT